MQEQDIEELVAEMSHISTISNDELGRAFEALCELWEGSQEYCNPAFVEALEQEIREQMEWFHCNCRIIKTTETHTSTYEEVEML